MTNTAGMRRVSVAEAKAQLPSLLREVDRDPATAIEVTRHGVVVGAIVGAKALAKIQKRSAPDPYRDWKAWRAKVNPSLLGDTDDLLVEEDEHVPAPMKLP